MKLSTLCSSHRYTGPKHLAMDTLNTHYMQISMGNKKTARSIFCRALSEKIKTLPQNILSSCLVSSVLILQYCYSAVIEKKKSTIKNQKKQNHTPHFSSPLLLVFQKEIQAESLLISLNGNNEIQNAYVYLAKLSCLLNISHFKWY